MFVFLLFLGLARAHSLDAVLQSLGLTSFASALASATDIDTSQALTIFAPDNTACESIHFHIIVLIS
jgi:hypothetical protein